MQLTLVQTLAQMFLAVNCCGLCRVFGELRPGAVVALQTDRHTDIQTSRHTADCIGFYCSPDYGHLLVGWHSEHLGKKLMALHAKNVAYPCSITY